MDEKQYEFTRSASEVIPGVKETFARALLTTRTRILRDRVADIALIMPVHNQEDIVYGNLVELSRSCHTFFELVIVDDASVDGTSDEIVHFLEDAPAMFENLTRLTFISSSQDIYETLCDSVAISTSTAPIVIEVQADMLIQDAGFDRRLGAILDTYPDIFAISGRGIHPFSEIVASSDVCSRLAKRMSSWLFEVMWATAAKLGLPNIDSKLLFFLTGRAGRLGLRIDVSDRTPRFQSVYVGGTVMRGPLAFRRCDFERLGGFDVQRFFLGNDDHDLIARAKKTLGMVSAYHEVAFDSPSELGSTRAPRSDANERRHRAIRHEFDVAAETSILVLSGSQLTTKRQVRAAP